MKTTENISLVGYAFTIESDAYIALENYLAEIQHSFEGNSSAAEIVADIEERIAELLNEMCKAGMTVNLNMINEIKSRIGDPRELTDKDEDSTQADAGSVRADEPGGTAKKGWRNKRLYRNIEERVLGGVCSGLGCYFKLDKALFRLAFIMVFLLGMIGADDGAFLIALAAYLCLWIAMPAARTVEQKCELKGKPMHLDSYKSKDFDVRKEVKEATQSPAANTVKRAGGAFLGMLLLIAGLSGLLACIFIPTLPELIRNSLADSWGRLDPGELLFVKIVTDRMFWWIVLAVCSLLFIWCIYNGVILTFGLKTPSWKPGLVLFILWIVSILALAAWVLLEVADALPGMVWW